MKERIIIERILFDEEGHVQAVDLHDEKFGEAIFCKKVDRHPYGKYNYEYE
jgi:hypothetical protein